MRIALSDQDDSDDEHNERQRPENYPPDDREESNDPEQYRE
jgi:hypothetical protein